MVTSFVKLVLVGKTSTKHSKKRESHFSSRWLSCYLSRGLLYYWIACWLLVSLIQVLVLYVRWLPHIIYHWLTSLKTIGGMVGTGCSGSAQITLSIAHRIWFIIQQMPFDMVLPRPNGSWTWFVTNFTPEASLLTRNACRLWYFQTGRLLKLAGVLASPLQDSTPQNYSSAQRVLWVLWQKVNTIGKLSHYTYVWSKIPFSHSPSSTRCPYKGSDGPIPRRRACC